MHFDQEFDASVAEPVHQADPLQLTEALLSRGLIDPSDARDALHTAQTQQVCIADVYCRDHRVAEYTITSLQSAALGCQFINPLDQLPDQSLIAAIGPERCLQWGVLPWRTIGSETIVLTCRLDECATLALKLEPLLGPVRIAITTQELLNRSVQEQCDRMLTQRAETKVTARESCRHWNARRALFFGVISAALLLVAFYVSPQSAFAVLTVWAVVTLALNTILKAVAAYIGWMRPPPPDVPNTLEKLPVITVLVPLFKETAIAEHLLARLNELTYPRALLDVCLVLEADDATTRATLGRTILPSWMRAIVVPQGTVKTKPRALNYALDFARGSIIGIWDAEDAPAKDQLFKVARGFATADTKVACLQGTLDYYNAGTNWLTRCFTIEYAAWFRVILPGLAKLGFVVPLGGTTLFFKREVLEELGGWDAHNVTEDADLGVRLARHGYRTEMVSTVTEEEANGRAWPWVKQRSRWLKGYAITYAVHMRDPIRLWRDLGAWRFFGVQLLFLGTLSQFVLAPILWTFWLLPFGITHPLSAIMLPWAFWTLGGLFILSEIIGFAAAIVGLRKACKPWLIKWALTLQFYFPLGALAAYKGLWELAWRPFYWDKTAHGVLLPQSWKPAPTLPLPQPAHPVSDA